MRFVNKYIVLLAFISFGLSAFPVCNADFTYSNPDDLTVNFTNLSESYNEGNIHYYWDFGDGSTSFNEEPTHTYSTPGIYKVTLNIITSELCYDRHSLSIFVGIPPTSPYCQLDIYFQTQNASGPDYNNGQAYVYGFSDVPCCYYAFWSNGMEGETITDLEPGTYCVTLTNGEQCYGTSCVTIGYNSNCTASFSVDSMTFSHLQGAYRFVNNSHGEAEEYFWDFGDGSVLYGNNPLHIYEEPGTYQVCLEIHTQYGCEDVFCKEINVGSTYPLLSNLNGNVFAGENNLPQGIAVLYKYYNDKFTAIQYSLINEGAYSFQNLSKDTLYLTHLIPYFNTDETYFPKYIPTYTRNKVYWQENNLLNLYLDTAYNSQLLSYNEIYYDAGNISGSVSYNDLATYEENVFSQTWFETVVPESGMAANTVVLLKDYQHNILDFSLTKGNGEYNFSHLDYGTYYLSVEKAGMISDEIMVIISAEELESINNNFHISQTNISNVSNEKSTNNVISFPNPVRDVLTICNLPEGNQKIQLLNNNGKIFFNDFLQSRVNIKIDVSDYPTGIYTLIIKTDNNVFVKKIVKL
ncbi:MAG: PKD domain-containing protein [Bacteroidales bacterium]|nr:PKD domain-containing protein [Bacteroidales bacterium]